MAFKITISPKYIEFYLAGRADEEDSDEEDSIAPESKVDVGDLAQFCAQGPDDFHTTIVRFLGSFVAPLEVGTEKRDWIAENHAAIKASGGDGSIAYRHYLKGLIDQCAFELEQEVCVELDTLGADEHGGDIDEPDGGIDDDEDHDENDAEGRL